MIGLRDTFERMKMKIIEHSLKLFPFKLLCVIPLINPIGSNGSLATTIPYNNHTFKVTVKALLRRDMNTIMNSATKKVEAILV